jgi:hypothetical protein
MRSIDQFMSAGDRLALDIATGERKSIDDALALARDVNHLGKFVAHVHTADDGWFIAGVFGDKAPGTKRSNRGQFYEGVAYSSKREAISASRGYVERLAAIHEAKVDAWFATLPVVRIPVVTVNA